MARKTLQELTMKDNFLFAAVMMDPENCRGVLECILGFEIGRVEVSREKSIVYNPEYHGVRLDVYARDEWNTHFDVEIQVIRENIFRRSRYYHSQMDMEALETGIGYERLPESYVIFICDFDPVGLEKYRYTRRQTFYEDAAYEYQDGTHTYFLNTKGKNDSEVPQPLVKFLKFVGAGLQESTEDYGDGLVSRLQTSIRQIKSSREMGNRFMQIEEMMKIEYESGKADGLEEGKIAARQEVLLETIGRLGLVSDELSHRITVLRDLSVLKRLLGIAMKAGSLEEFEAGMDSVMHPTIG